MAAYTVNTYQPIDRIGLAQAIGTTSTTKYHALGDRVKARDVSGSRGDAEFIYLQGVVGTGVGSIVLIKDDYTTSLVAARDCGALAVATAAVVASNYGWYQIKGIGVIKTGGDGVAAAGSPIYIAAAGEVGDDLAVAGDQIIGMRSASATDTATCLVTMACNPAAADFDNA